MPFPACGAGRVRHHAQPRAWHPVDRGNAGWRDGPGETGVGAKNFSPLRPPPSSSVSPPDQPSSRPAATHTLPGGPSPSAGLPRGTSRTIGSIVRGFKIGVTKWFRQNTSRGVAWQRNYYEHIIRDETSLRQIREYIVANPQRWSLDHENPENLTRRLASGQPRVAGLPAAPWGTTATMQRAGRNDGPSGGHWRRGRWWVNNRSPGGHPRAPSSPTAGR